MMNRQRIALIGFSIVAVILLFQLPRVVVENETSASVETHDLAVSQADKATISRLRDSLNRNQKTKKSVNFADSLASLFLKYQLVDSAVRYADWILSVDSINLKAANIYYRAFQSAIIPDEAKHYAGRAGEIFEKLLIGDSENYTLKNKLAMTLMVTENPMSGVQLLREVLNSDPQNREALLNLGLLSIRSGQFERATERFDELIDLDSMDAEALFYKGVALSESGKTGQARDVFDRMINLQNVDPALKATAMSYLEEI